MTAPQNPRVTQAPVRVSVRPIRIEGEVAYIPLTRGYEAIIDAADVPLVAGRNWRAHVAPRNVYARGALYGTGVERAVLLHRIIMGDPEGMDVDHRDGDGLNNRRSNLRVATLGQNRRNQKLAKHNTSGLKGASWHKRNGKWYAAIKVDGRTRHLGCYDTPEAAHEAYCKASAELHGEFGRFA